MIAAWCNGEPVGALPLTSRAAHYGDGAFTTMRVHESRVCVWSAHRRRLEQASAVLHLLPPDFDALQLQVEREAARAGSAVIKIALVPQSGERAYARAWPSSCDSYVFLHPLPAHDPLRHRDGTVLDEAVTVTAGGDAFGIKTLCRLDQVLAATVAHDREPLLCDRDGFVLGARSARARCRAGVPLRCTPLSAARRAGGARCRVPCAARAGGGLRCVS
jgi:4-amino-4-deoxychorismate lyase